MESYESFSRTELLEIIDHLKKENEQLASHVRGHNARDHKSEVIVKYAGKIFDSLPVMLTILDHSGTIVDYIPSGKNNYTGSIGNQLIGTHISHILPDEAYNKILDNLESVITTHLPSTTYYSLQNNNRLRHFENYIFPLNDQHIFCIFHDITDSENELKTLKYAVNRAMEEIYSCSLDGTIKFANQHFIDRHHLSQPLSQYKIYDLNDSLQGREQWEEKIRIINSTENKTLKYTTRYAREKENNIAQEIVASIIQDPSKESTIWFFARDISLRMEQENKIKELNYIMDAILNNIPVYLFVKDPGNDFKYLYWNKAFEEYSHIPATHALGRTDFEIFPNRQDAEKFRKDDLLLLKTRERLEFQEEYVTATGETRVVSTSKALVPTENKIPLVIGVSWDITELKESEKELISARIKAEQSDRLKSAFLANMSHEIRTPLNAIVGFSKLMAETTDEGEKQQYCDIIDNNSEMLLQLINDILDISKIEAGTLTFINKPFDLSALCQDIFEVHKNRVKKGVELIFENNRPGLILQSDQNRIAQVITNLITNAIKFTDQGNIRFGFYIKNEQINFYVIDTGHGVPKEKIDTIFDRFIKLNNFAQGTGLGLSICKMILEKIGGTISLESEEGRGSTFRFTIPYKNEINKKETIKPIKSIDTMVKTQLQGKKILIAEDIESNFLLLKVCLEKNYNLVRAKDGVEAIAKFKECNPDLIFMDIKMPEMDGLDATKIIRNLSPDIPIIALTAFAFEEDKQKAFKAGCNDFITKPVSFKRLNEILNQYLHTE